MQALEQMRYESERVIRIFLNQIFLLILHPPSPQDGQFRAELYILSWKTYFKPTILTSKKAVCYIAIAIASCS